MAKIKISGEQPFQVGAPRFCIGQTPAGYTLQYSADGVHFTCAEWKPAFASGAEKTLRKTTSS